MRCTTIMITGLLVAMPAMASDDFAISGEGFTTAADVRQHNRLPLDLAAIREALAEPEPDFARALARYAFGGGFAWRDSFHSLAYFADDYQGRMRRVLTGAMELEADPAFAHHQIVSALMGTGSFSGDGTRSQPAEMRRAFVETALLATILNWCRLELSEASIRGPERGNWSLANGSPKNWSELFAFWYGPEAEHSLHAEMTRIAERFDLPEHPTRLVTGPLTAGQPTLLDEEWPEAEARRLAQALDHAALLLLLDRTADLEAADDPAALAAVRGAWIAAGDSLARADVKAARDLQEALRADAVAPAGLAAQIRGTIKASLAALELDAEGLGAALSPA
jgi:hypothetical protein